MKKIKAAIFTLCLIPAFAMATAQKMEMIFLSPQKVSMILELLDRYEVMKMSANLVQADMANCTPMGDGCFHPQYGYIEKKPESMPARPELLEDKKLELKNFNAVETSLVNCDKNNYFDIWKKIVCN